MTTFNEPNNIDAEKAIIGALLLDVNYHLCKQALDLLDSDSFYSYSNRLIFNLIKERAENKQTVDLITTTDELEKRGELEKSGGFVYIAEIIRSSISKENTLAYVDLINKLSAKRMIIKIAYTAIEKSNELDPGEIIEFIETNLKSISSKDTGKSARHISEFGTEWLDDFEKQSKIRGNISGLETGIAELDEMISGFDLEGLFVLAGRPSMGKTLLAQTILDHVGGTNQKNCLFFSMEMSEKQVYQRFVSKASNVCPKKIRSASDLSNEDWGKISEGVRRVNESKIYIDADAKLSVSQIRARSRRHASKFGYISLIVIDYLGLMGKPKADRNDIAIGEITSSLKCLAKELGTPILLLVQASRELDKNKRPTMSDLKDSSSIEADADVVMFVHRQEVIDPDTELKGVTELIIAKDRHNDGGGTIYLSKVNGGFNSLDSQTVAEMCQREEAKKIPRRGYNNEYKK